MRRWLSLAVTLAWLGAGCGGDTDAVIVEAEPAPETEPASGPWFVDRAQETGLDFVHFNGMSGEYYYPEIMPPGVGLFDYDNDDDLDVYVVQGHMLGGKDPSIALFPPPARLGDRLFRNDLQVNPDGTRSLRFVDVTESAGLEVTSYGMGVAAGDFDNDGWVDLYRTGLDRGTLLRNNGDGTFRDVTAASGTENRDRWGVSAAFVDVDRDGRLDLYVGNYLIYTIEGDISCLAISGQNDYCPPNSYRPQTDRLFRNLDGERFEDVTTSALTGGTVGPALGVSTADFDSDGWPDIYVANDGTQNQLWMNQGDGTFRDAAFLSGAAVNASGNAESSMGVDAGDFDGDGDEDLFMTHWLAQTNTLYVNDGTGNFQDRTAGSGLAPPSLAQTGFGAAWLDYDNDGWLDLLAVNGAVAQVEAQALDGERFPLRELNQLFHNRNGTAFDDVSAAAGPAFELSEVSRGAAFGDVDNDGDVDVVIGNVAGRLRLLVNEIGSRQHWLGLRVVHGDPPRDALGTRVRVVRDGHPPLARRARSDGSYASANDPRILVGLGDGAVPATVEVTWPDQSTARWPDLAIDTWHVLRKGDGQP